MKSVGEVAIYRPHSAGIPAKSAARPRSGRDRFDPKVNLMTPDALTRIRRELKEAGGERIWYIADAFRAGLSVDGVFNLTNVDRWFRAD